MALQHLPVEFRVKYDQLLGATDSRTGKPVTDSLGPPNSGMSLKPMASTGGARVEFQSGALYQFDHTGRFPIVAIWGRIAQFYSYMGDWNSGFGRPLTDVVDIPDGGRCAIFEGGHIHEYGAKAEPFPPSQCGASYKPEAPTNPFGTGPAGMPAAFHKKWMEACCIRAPDGKTVAESLWIPNNGLSDNGNGGQRFDFYWGDIISLDNNTPPVITYGEIRKKWYIDLGGVSGGLGHPLADLQELGDGGYCQVFEGGHVHQHGTVAHTTSPDKCTARNQPLPRAPSWNSWPPHFQRKWTALCGVVHPHTRDTVVEMLWVPSGGLSDNPNDMGGQIYKFYYGALISLSKDPPPSTYYTPPVSYNQPGPQPSQGFPPGSPPASSDPSAFYNRGPPGPQGMSPPPGAMVTPPPHAFAGVMKGGQLGSSPAPEPPTYNNIYFPNAPQHIPGFNLSPNAVPLELTEPFAVYGKIHAFWYSAGELKSVYGRPLCDEQDLPDGGRCSIFEGGHIHLYNGVAQGVPADSCTAAFQPKPPPRRAPETTSQPAPQPPMDASRAQDSSGYPKIYECCLGCNIVCRERGGDCRCGECIWGTWSV